MNDDQTNLPAAPESRKVSFDTEVRDDFEVELLEQIRETHVSAMHCYQQGIREVTSLGNKIGYLNLAAKLTRSYAALMQAFDHHRGKGTVEQKITVQYVNVADGGNAVIGNVASQGQEGGAKK